MTDTCPKCGARLREVSTFSRSSSLDNSGAVINRVAGHSCWRCGVWLEAAVVAMPYEPKKHGDPTGHGRKGEIKDFCERNKAKIITMRRAGLTYAAIAQALGAPTVRSSIQKFYSGCQV